MIRPHHDDDDVVERKWPTLVRCPTTRTRTPPILPDELILEILLRLPVRSLVQFRSVCNSWRTLISSPQFAKDHLQRSIGDPTLTHPRCVYFHSFYRCHTIGVFSIQSLLENPSAPTKVVSFGRGRHRKVVGSCNGLLCLYEPDRDAGETRVILWNPCTGLTSEWLDIGGTISAHGFGYDHVHDKYKLFVVVGPKLGPKSGGTVAKIFTFGENCWRTIQDSPFRMDRTGLLVSGTLNWVYSPGGWDWAIVSLDLGKETYGRLSLPDRDADDDTWFTPTLGVLRNCLAVGLDYKKTHWGVWLMKEYGVHQSWTKLLMIPHDPLDHRHFFLSLRPVYISENDVLLARSPYPNTERSKLVLYNSNGGRLDFPMIDSSSDGMLECPMSDRVGGRTLLIYHDSLVSPSHCGLQSFFSEMPFIKPSL